MQTKELGLSGKPHRLKSVKIQSFFGPYFPVFGPGKTTYLDTLQGVTANVFFLQA